MNLLQLVQMVKREAGISGAMPSTVLNQVEEINRVTGWVNSAWRDIQTMHVTWEFMRTPFSFNTVAQQQSYSPVQVGVTKLSGAATVSNLGNWKLDSFRKYFVANGSSSEMILPFVPYGTFRDLYLFGTQRTNYAPPAVFTMDPNKNLLLGNCPDAIYNINGECYTKAVTLALDADTPTMPEEFHDAIVWRAIGHYGMYEAASESVARANKEYPKWINRLMADQLPKFGFGGPLA